MFYYEMRILPVRMPGEVYQIVLGRWVRVNRREGTAMVTFGTLLPGSRKHRPKLWSEVFDALPSDEVGANCLWHKKWRWVRHCDPETHGESRSLPTRLPTPTYGRTLNTIPFPLFEAEPPPVVVP
jgi:hypothetical protein